MSKQQLVLKERLSLSLYDDEADRDTPSDTELQSAGQQLKGATKWWLLRCCYAITLHYMIVITYVFQLLTHKIITNF